MATKGPAVTLHWLWKTAAAVFFYGAVMVPLGIIIMLVMVVHPMEDTLQDEPLNGWN